MTEPGPASFSLFAAFVAVLGPVLGPYALIVFAAGVGAAMALSTNAPTTRLEGAKFLAMGTLLAIVLTSPCVWLVTHYTDVPANIALIPVAFVLGLAKAKLFTLINLALDGMAATAGAIFNRGQRGGGQ
jgi:hypothetical protein